LDGWDQFGRNLNFGDLGCLKSGKTSFVVIDRLSTCLKPREKRGIFNADHSAFEAAFPNP
jgi:hypothetical protein